MFTFLIKVPAILQIMFGQVARPFAFLPGKVINLAMMQEIVDHASKKYTRVVRMTNGLEIELRMDNYQAAFESQFQMIKPIDRVLWGTDRFATSLVAILWEKDHSQIYATNDRIARMDPEKLMPKIATWEEWGIYNGYWPMKPYSEACERRERVIFFALGAVAIYAFYFFTGGIR